ncbi:MAG: FimV protein, partial [Pseudomonadota bacterium]
NASAAQNLKTTADTDKQLYVEVNDTLYSIADTNRPAADVSVAQMMLALQRLNPESFPSGNINNLKAGTLMTLPTEAQAKELSKRQALAETKRQWEEWQTGRTAPEIVKSEDSVDAKETQPVSAPVEEPTQPIQDDAQLKLLAAKPAQQKQEENPKEVQAEAPLEESPVDETAVNEVVQSEQVDNVAATSDDQSMREQQLEQANRDLEDRLLVTQESVAKVERDNADLSDKLDAIQEQLVAMQRLIELKDQQMAQLQKELLTQVEQNKLAAEDPIISAINYLRNNPTHLGAGTLVLLLILLLLLRSSRKAATKSNLPDAPAPSVAVPVATAATAEAVIDSQTIASDQMITTAVSPDPAQTKNEVQESIAQAEAEIQSMIDEVLRARAKEQSEEPVTEVVDQDFVSESEREPEPEPELEIVSQAVSEVVSADSLHESEPEQQSSEPERQPEAAPADELLSLSDFDDEGIKETGTLATESSVNAEGLDDELNDSIETMLGELGESIESEEQVVEEQDLKFGEEGVVASFTELNDLDLEQRANQAMSMQPRPAAETDLDFNVTPFDKDAPAERTESEIPVVEMSITTESKAPISSANDSSSVDEDDDHSVINLEAEFAALETEGQGAVDDELWALAGGKPAVSTELVEQPVAESEGAEGIEEPLESLDGLTFLDDSAAEVQSDKVSKPEPIEELLEFDIEQPSALDAELDDILGEVDSEIEIVEEFNDQSSYSGDESELFSGTDENETRLDLARAYIDMDDSESARDILSAISRTGSVAQRAEADALLKMLDKA